MAYLIAHYASILNIIGAAFEIVGVMLMSHRYTNSPLRQIPLILLTAQWSGGYARNAANFADFSTEKVLLVLRGLSMIGMGFFISAIPNAVQLFH